MIFSFFLFLAAYASQPSVEPSFLEIGLFEVKVIEVKLFKEIKAIVMHRLPEVFTKTKIE